MHFIELTDSSGESRLFNLQNVIYISRRGPRQSVVHVVGGEILLNENYETICKALSDIPQPEKRRKKMDA